jgi:hypothetical protein
VFQNHTSIKNKKPLSDERGSVYIWIFEFIFLLLSYSMYPLQKGKPNAAAAAENTNLRLSSSPRCLQLPVDSIKIDGDKHDK